LMKKSEVNGGKMNEVFAWLKNNASESGSIKWYVSFHPSLPRPRIARNGELTNRNFTKFLVDKEGKVVGRYGPQKTPEQLIPEIEKLL
jgi:glutathione peroxidase-family protein